MLNANKSGKSEQKPFSDGKGKGNSYVQTILELEIKTYDIDVAGHVNNAVYVQWVEDLRTELFNGHFNLPELIKKKLYPIVISTDIEYKKFLKLYDKPVGVMKIESLNHGIFTLQAEISVEGEIAASAMQKCVITDLEKSAMITGSQLQEIIKDLQR
jgi:acyl-CoA thioester hydrolase